MKTTEQFDALVNYFTGKILAKEYELINISEHTVEIKIDETYDFSLWISNTWEAFKSYSGYFNSVFLTFSEENQKELHSHFRNELKTQQNTPELIAKRKAEFEKLKAEFMPEL